MFDAHWQISDLLFIKEVKFKKSWSGGATTEIHCTFGDAFTEKAEAGKSRSGKAGIGKKSSGQI
ncbi:MAG: hypothetical protein LRY32_03825 [Flavobacterium sp.]|nr:hypothetical protein [Flavobacterium sp.]